MRYYLSGAITGNSDFKNYFKRFEDELHSHGIEDIFNPASIDWAKDTDWAVCMRHDIKALMECDCLILLPNWKGSKGVELERHLCKELGIRVIKYNSLLRELKGANNAT